MTFEKYGGYYSHDGTLQENECLPPTLFVFHDTESGIMIEWHWEEKRWFLKTPFHYTEIKPGMAAAIVRGMSERHKQRIDEAVWEQVRMCTRDAVMRSVMAQTPRPEDLV